MEAMKPISASEVRLLPGFWKARQTMVRQTMVPYQWAALNDAIAGAEPSHAMENWRIAAGESSGHHQGFVFQDSDLFKWLEAVGHLLSEGRDAELEAQADAATSLLARAQAADGYLNSYYQIEKPDRRWTNLRDDHELYCAGHLIEAAVAYSSATGKEDLLTVARRLADHLCERFGRSSGKIHGYPGHPEVELALVKLYRWTGELRYLELARFFVEARGQEPKFFAEEAAVREDPRPYDPGYAQSHAPLVQQTTAEGHAVRAMYLFSGAADVAAELGDSALAETLKRLWDNVTEKRMYLTGGIGSSAWGEAFTADYDLPADRAYAETCAAIGLIFWAQRMLRLDADGKYGDTIERALYNGVLSGVSSEGDRYFYVNPLEVWPSIATVRHDMQAITVERQAWFGCACCPPNLARLVASLPGYVYSYDGASTTLAINLYMPSELTTEIAETSVKIRQETQYPWQGRVRLDLETSKALAWTLKLRIPKWTPEVRLSINGTEQPVQSIERGYLAIMRVWENGDQVVLDLSMPARVVYPHPSARSLAGQVALERGPMVYCLEEADNGANLAALRIEPQAHAWEARWQDGVAGGVMALVGSGHRLQENSQEALYAYQAWPTRPTELTAIPYYAWANRGMGEMRVWMSAR